jgi:hypothetical protein
MHGYGQRIGYKRNFKKGLPPTSLTPPPHRPPLQPRILPPPLRLRIPAGNLRFWNDHAIVVFNDTGGSEH